MASDTEGKFFALEGPDGCGKSTQLNMLAEWLESKNIEVRKTKEPTDTPMGKLLRKNLENKIDVCPESEALLFAGDRAQHVSNEIRPKLEEGNIVITGRYLLSSLVYQSIRGLSEEWIEEINRHAIIPNLTIIIDVPPKTGLKRVNKSGEPDIFEEDLEMQKKVREKYLKLAKEKNMPIIDGTLSKDKVHKKIKKQVKKVLHADLSGER